jgi:hypothetical protein
MSGDPSTILCRRRDGRDHYRLVARVRWFFVIARGSAFAYKSRDIDPNESLANRCSLYLMAASGAPTIVSALRHSSSTPIAAAMFGHEATTALSDIFAVQDEITQTNRRRYRPNWGRAERKERGSSNGQHRRMEHHQRGMFHVYRYASRFAQARKLFEDAIAIDADLGPPFRHR